MPHGHTHMRMPHVRWLNLAVFVVSLLSSSHVGGQAGNLRARFEQMASQESEVHVCGFIMYMYYVHRLTCTYLYTIHYHLIALHV